MIKSKKELKFYILADRMMNRGYFQMPIFERIKRLFIKDYVLQFLVEMRKCQYYSKLGGGEIFISL